MANQYTTSTNVALNSVTPTLLTPASANGRGYVFFENNTAIDIFISTDPAVATSGTHMGKRLCGGLTPPDEFVDGVSSSAWYPIASSGTPSLTMLVCQG
jgi:hypothetical protein